MFKSFVIVVPSFNNALWCRQNLDSIFRQDYPRFRLVYIDDASTDDTARFVAEYFDEKSLTHRVTFVRNEVRVGPLANIDRAVRSCDPSEVVALVDGDDFLAHDRVLTRLNAIYRDPDVWVTWGQFIRFPQGGEGFCAAIPPEIVSANAFRDHPFVSSHLRTFYAGLYQRVRPVDLQDGDGRFFTIAGDVAQMFALMEMAGSRARFVDEVLYHYNRENPLNDDKVDRAGQFRTELAIRGKARYGRLPQLDGTRRPSEFCVGSGLGRSLFDDIGSFPDPNQRRQPFRKLRSVLNRLGYTVRETQTFADVEEPHAIAVFDVRPTEMKRLSKYPSDMLTLILWENPISAPFNFDVQYHQPFGRIFTWCNDLVDNVRYFKLHFPFLRPMIDDVVPFEKRKLCVLMASNRYADHPDELYSEERNVAEFFADAEPDSFDLFGVGWDPARYQNYRGVFPKKLDRLRRYRFSFCYETIGNGSGYVTGKIFDSFEAGCVPIYRGAPDIADLVPSDCFVARRDFGSDRQLHAFLRDMPESVHAGYLDRIRTFLSSQRAIPFTAEHFVRVFVDLVGGRATRQDASSHTSGGVDSPSERTGGGAGGALTCPP
jgi:glycosyltransferase involved in cell wall biosynthesis